MGENSKIEWTHHTFNPWRGCTKVSEGCRHCYAEKTSKRNPAVLGEWGPKGTRVIASESYWKQPLKWNRNAEAAGERRRVFCASLADVFEDREELKAPRLRLFKLIQNTPQLDWLLLTKRPENILYLLPADWAEPIYGGIPRNVWLGTSVENQAAADERIPHLLQVPAAVRFLSCEPLLGPVDLSSWMWKVGCNPHCGEHCSQDADCPCEQADQINWVIVGGESGPHARPMHPDWARSLRDQCQAAGVAFHFKQWGEFVPGAATEILGGRPGWCSFQNGTIGPCWNHQFDERTVAAKVGKKTAGRTLDSRTWDELPELVSP